MAERKHSPLAPEGVEPHMCSIDLRLEILGQVPFFAGLAPQEIAKINRLFVEKGFEPGEMIYFADEPGERLYVVAAGKVKVLRHTFSGKDVLLDILKSGEFFGNLSTAAEATYPDSAQALTPVCVLSISTPEFRQVLDQHPGVALKVLDITSARLSAAQEMVRQLSAFPVEKRIAYALLKMGEKLGEPQALGLLIHAPLSRDDLAGMTGTTTESASRVISQFQKDGLVRTGRQWVALTDPQKLAELLEA